MNIHSSPDKVMVVVLNLNFSFNKADGTVKLVS